MSGLYFTLGGKLDPSYKGSLQQAETEARAAGVRINNSLRSQISAMDRQLASSSPGSARASAAAIQKAHLENALLIATNGRYLAAAKQRIAMREEEAAAARATGKQMSELERYLASPSQSPLVNPRENLAADQAAFETRRNALRGMLQTMREIRSESERYLASPSQAGFANPRGSMASDQAAWAAKLAAYRSKIGSSGLTAAGWAEKMAGNLAVATANATGLNLILRETLVVFRELGRGNWSRIPGSLSLIAQGFSTLEGISLKLIGAWAFAIAGIMGSFFIFHARVKSLTRDLQTTLRDTFNPEHLAAYLGKLNILNQLEKDVADSVRKVQEAHDAVADSMQRQLDLTQDRIAYERQLLEVQKENELAATKNPAEREAIEKKYSGLILANRKKERDAQVAAMREESAGLYAEVKKTKAEIQKLTSGDYITEGRDAQILKERQQAAAAYDDYRKQLLPGAEDTRDFSADKDRALIRELEEKKTRSAAINWAGVVPGDVSSLPPQFSAADQARLDAAKSRLKNAADTQKSLNDWIDAGDARNRARLRVKELEDRVTSDAERLAKLNGTRGDNGTIADTMRKNLQKDQEDLALEKARLARVEPGRPLNGREVTERERVGIGSPQVQMLDVQRSMDRKLGILVDAAKRKNGGHGSFNDPFAGF